MLIPISHYRFLGREDRYVHNNRVFKSSRFSCPLIGGLEDQE